MLQLWQNGTHRAILPQQGKKQTGPNHHCGPDVPIHRTSSAATTATTATTKSATASATATTTKPTARPSTDTRELCPRITVTRAKRLRIHGPDSAPAPKDAAATSLPTVLSTTTTNTTAHAYNSTLVSVYGYGVAGQWWVDMSCGSRYGYVPKPERGAHPYQIGWGCCAVRDGESKHARQPDHNRTDRRVYCAQLWVQYHIRTRIPQATPAQPSSQYHQERQNDCTGDRITNEQTFLYNYRTTHETYS